ncbi:hypothetical protein HELRODRAFT_103156 [Helobdella robusta]|uniref:Nbr1 FW domain-containing protein n=1 Tax=Helobdella robusta TaxID=6412 RepID=T1EDE5_HELRO|nr:hypothetical protein HELRODRAFT_103156 [Helobdella robusta]ESN94016.1 hypothetical protein HELRODRAFT_103156 [Helobdella robusta]
MEVGSSSNNSSSDVDVDTILLQQFSCMATQDKEALINQFENLFGSSKPDREVCAFYLEMNNWNLPAAVGSYFELNYDQTLLPSITSNESSSSTSDLFATSPFLLETTTETSIVPSASQEGDRQLLIRPPNFKFHHCWDVKNNGLAHWPAGCTLRFISGTQMSLVDRVSVERLGPFAVAKVGLDLITPEQPGNYESTWQLSTMTGTLFGDEMKLYVQVTNDINLLKNLGYDVLSLANGEMMTTEDSAMPSIELLNHENCQDNDGGIIVCHPAAVGITTLTISDRSVSHHQQQEQQHQTIDPLDSDYMEMS